MDAGALGRAGKGGHGRGRCLDTRAVAKLPFDEWTDTFGTERLTGALLDRVTHHINILELNPRAIVSPKTACEEPVDTLAKIADAASARLWSGYALLTFHACGASWLTFAPARGRSCPAIDKRG